jgi:enoyl-CoA hydratase/carnithine racemase
MADYVNITLERDGAVARLMLNRPERRNTLTHAMMLELEDAFAAIRDNPSCRALVLRGAGEAALDVGADRLRRHRCRQHLSCEQFLRAELWIVGIGERRQRFWIDRALVLRPRGNGVGDGQG